MTPWLRTPTNASRFWMCSVPKPAVPWPVWVVFILGIEHLSVFRSSPRESDPHKNSTVALLVTQLMVIFWTSLDPKYMIIRDYTILYMRIVFQWFQCHCVEQLTYSPSLGLQTSVWVAKQHIQVEHIYIYLIYYLYIDIQWDSTRVFVLVVLSRTRSFRNVLSESKRTKPLIFVKIIRVSGTQKIL